jgi:hypothetical protein
MLDRSLHSGGTLRRARFPVADRVEERDRDLVAEGVAGRDRPDAFSGRRARVDDQEAVTFDDPVQHTRLRPGVNGRDTVAGDPKGHRRSFDEDVSPASFAPYGYRGVDVKR